MKVFEEIKKTPLNCLLLLFTFYCVNTICVYFYRLLISIFIMLSLIGSLITAYEHFVKIETNGHFTSSLEFDNITSKSVNGEDINIRPMHRDDAAANLEHKRKGNILTG